MEFFDKRDATAALDGLDRHMMDDREISIVFAKDRRKTAEEMRPRGRADSRDRGRGGDRYGNDHRGGDYRGNDNHRGDYRGGDRRRDDRRWVACTMILIGSGSAQ